MGTVRQRKEKSKNQKRALMWGFALWTASGQSCWASSEKPYGICLRITLTAGIFHLVEIKVAPRSTDSYASRFCKCLWKPSGKEEERPRSLRWEGVDCLSWLVVNAGGLKDMGRQSAAFAKEVLVMDALHIWFCNKVGEICQTIKINICNVDNKNSCH